MWIVLVTLLVFVEFILSSTKRIQQNSKELKKDSSVSGTDRGAVLGKYHSRFIEINSPAQVKIRKSLTCVHCKHLFEVL